jgi:two-component system cell cycle response regulator
MTTSRQILCIEPSPTQRAIITEAARQNGLAVVHCHGESDTVARLDSHEHYCLAIIANELADGDSFQIIDTLRLSLTYATLPIALITSNRDPALARNAMNAGATEVFLRDEPDTLAAFIGECANQGETESFIGKVLLVEDSDSHANYVTQLCQAIGLEAERVNSVEDALAVFRPEIYALVIVDVVLNDTRSGISFVRHIRQNHLQRQPTLIISGYDDLPRRLLALKSGTDDFISKPFSPEEFLWRVRKILHAYAGHDFGATTPALPAPSCTTTADLLTQLSPRERELCQRVIAGASDKEIARELGISFWTVRSHIEQIFIKTGALNRRELMARFISQ